MPWRAVFLVLLAVPVASAQLDVAFKPPGQWKGETVLEGTWLVVTLENPNGLLRLESPDAVATNYTVPWTSALAGNVLVSGRHEYVPSQEEGRGAVAADVAFSKPGRAAFVVLADRVSVAAGHAAGEVRHLGTNTTPRDAVAVEGKASTFVYAPYDVSGHAAMAHVGSRTTPLSIEVEGVRVVEWINASVECATAFCPSGGGFWGRRQDAPGLQARGYVFSYTEVTSPGGSLFGSVDARAWAVGGESVDAAVRGWLRLPSARLDASCGCVEEDGSIQVDGNVTLSGLHAEDDRLQVRLGGNASWLQLDEQGLDPSILGRYDAAGAVAAAVAMGLLLNLAAAGLLASNRNRRRIHELILSSPGITYRAIVRTTGLSTTTCTHHLDKLLAARLVVRRQQGRWHHYFENHGRHGQTDQAALAAVQDEALRLLLALLARVGRVRQSWVIKHAEATLGWKPTTTQRRLHRLAAAGLLETWKDGGRWYEAAPPAKGVLGVSTEPDGKPTP